MRFFRSETGTNKPLRKAKKSRFSFHRRSENDMEVDGTNPTVSSATTPQPPRTSSLKRISDSRASTATDDSEFDPSTPSRMRPSSMRHTDSCVPRHSLAGFRQLQCSMSYKSRMSMVQSGMDELRLSGISSNGHKSPRRSSSSSSFHTSSPPTSTSDLRLTQAGVVALQTRRAFQQMVLAIEDEEDSSDESGSDSSRRHRYFSRLSSIESLHSGVVQVGLDEYLRFQSQLKHLEEVCREQARQQEILETKIQEQVEVRTLQLKKEMEKKIRMYQERRHNDMTRTPTILRQTSIPPTHPTALSAASLATKSSSSKPFDKLLHSRRSRKRMEREIQEQEQFRAFIRSTEETRWNSQTIENARASIQALGDPHITEDLLDATPSTLMEMICMLRTHVRVQEEQLDQAKELISSALAAREEAEETALEAVELTMVLDSKLERASQEVSELRHSSASMLRSRSDFNFSFLENPQYTRSAGSLIEPPRSSLFGSTKQNA